jgi:acyl-CoA thioesterase I
MAPSSLHKTMVAFAFVIVAIIFSLFSSESLAEDNAMRASADSTINIVAIGASNTAGWGVGSQNAYPTQLEVMLKAKGYNVQVANAGKSFDTTAGMLRRLDAAVLQRTCMVIVQPGGNDLRFFGSKEQRARNIAAIADRLRARNIKVIMFENTIVPSDLYQWDGIHFTAKGHKWVASYLMRRVLALIDTYGLSD